jgi:hypothetical protein
MSCPPQYPIWELIEQPPPYRSDQRLKEVCFKTMSDSTPPSERFKTNLLIFVDFFKGMFQEAKEENLIQERISMLPIIEIIIKRTSSDDIVKWFIERTYKYWDKIYQKDGDYVEEISTKLFQMVQDGKLDDLKQSDQLQGADEMMGSLSKGHIDNFKEVLTGSYEDEETGETVKVFDDERKEELWSYLQAFVKISINHIHFTRQMGENGKYKTKFFPTVDGEKVSVKKLAVKWGIKLR